MFFAHRTCRRLALIGFVLLVWAAVAGVLAFLLPVEGALRAFSFTRWFIGIPLALAAMAVLEACGTGCLSRWFWQRMPSFARFILLALLVVSAVAGGLFLGAETRVHFGG